MPKQYSQYFNGIIEELTIEPKKYLERVSFWRTIEKTKEEYFMLCSLEGSKDFKLKIKIEKDKYEKSKVGDEVAIHLDFSYGYTCFHDIKEERKPEILDVEKSY